MISDICFFQVEKKEQELEEEVFERLFGVGDDFAIGVGQLDPKFCLRIVGFSWFPIWKFVLI